MPSTRSESGQSRRRSARTGRRPFRIDHRQLGTGFLSLGVVGGLLGALLSLSLRGAPPWLGGTAADPALLATFHGLLLVMFCALPILVGGFGNWFLPVMAGAADNVAPRVSVASLAAAVVGIVALGTGIAASGSSPSWSSSAVAVALICWSLSFLLGAGGSLATILCGRASGVALHHLPVFAWCQLATALLGVLTVPVLLAHLFLHLLRGTFDPVVAGHFFALPQMALVLLPALGVMSAIVPTFAGRLPRLSRTSAYASLLAAAGVGALWARAAMTTGRPPEGTVPAVCTAMLIAAGAVTLLGWGATLRGGRALPRVPLLWAMGFVVLAATGFVATLAGLMAGSPLASAASFASARLHDGVLLSAVCAGCGGFYYWIGKMSGRGYPEALARLQFWLFFVGSELTFLPALGAGPTGTPIAPAGQASGLAVLRSLSWNGTLLSVASAFVFLLVLVVLLVRPKAVAANPWGAGAVGREWSLPSPLPRQIDRPGAIPA
ncbi:cbb3-type cytochrome c oxidase subunit I [Rhizosaccharibacter radicis]|uniref:Cbb3-type cytochrome c oxidase subunit I n=1 Tax=Rhizosaccharibacter radicis TaxID=2782605 RepID=A0ABT1VY98_9PROT|nr:cbb3-type cytochrome c oxidase subunit I [Acetobacteraceae bacterium KSS12]